MVLPSRVWAAGELIHRCSGVTAASPEFDLVNPDKIIFRFDWMNDSVTSAITLDSTSVMALGPNLIFGRPPVILPVKRHPCARTQPPAPFRKTVSVKLRFARPYWNEPVISRPIRCGSRIGAKRNRHTLNFSPRDCSEMHKWIVCHSYPRCHELLKPRGKSQNRIVGAPAGRRG